MKGYPDEYDKYQQPDKWLNLTPKKALSIIDDAFAKGLITCRGEMYSGAREAWGSHPDAIVAEVPDTDLYIDVSIVKDEDKKMYEARCDCCLWNVKKRGMEWCDNENKACKNVEKCPERIW